MSSLRDCDKANDVVMMCEVMKEASYVKHHKKKLVYIFSAMRHFALQLHKLGYKVCYTKLDDPKNTGSFYSEIQRVVEKLCIQKLIVTEPGEYRVLKDIQSWQKDFSIDVEIRIDDRFLATIGEFTNWAKGYKQLRMEYFYRYMRIKHDILLDNDGNPEGGQWNYDSQNRKTPSSDIKIPDSYKSVADDITKRVIELVGQTFVDNFGDIKPFNYAVTREQALEALDLFVKERLSDFGDYQDAMLEGQAWMYHSHISMYINSGLLLPMECIKAAVKAYYNGNAPLNAVEGFIRQILGWREFVRGIYWLKMPGYRDMNYLGATRKLPSFYWDANNKMNCLYQCVKETKQNAYAHHIQRLMVLGNFALLAGIDPKYVNEWYLLVYADAYEWVELPNVSGMVLFADGGYLASKPYAASGSYIKKMSNYCDKCHYSVNKKNGIDACPFNYLYWDFLARNKSRLATNPRLAMIYKSYENMTDEKKELIRQDSKKFLEDLGI
ncbi:cryptochrome/photolyase family protein [Francisella tularensis]|uniref:cryptochrome/photolyase family protein n=1 Tax=Francisella tularensis TaxID=263 RepID=UPI001E306D3E|nr:cryptochrome/photolyase family protein [Francisella tularensis]MCH4979426.1 cryptochrome/photolyase family protein [Francisella tularensis]MCH4981148.1 cryptochrome/photolyase family protein [Francisella tularensis]MCH4982584.1 cryptochrome/photolyase family protein [Francisella tularensis]UJM49414.1 cryptochrome/photolyase family protein [Francisella tularensis]